MLPKWTHRRRHLTITKLRETLDFVITVGEAVFNRNGRTAIFRPKSKHEYEIIEYFASVSRNRGWNIYTFAGRDEAIAWLIAD